MNPSNRDIEEQEILTLDTAFLKAILEHNVDLVETTLPADFLSVFPDGSVADKSVELENVKNAPLESYSTDELQVYWYSDNLAIVNFRLSLKMKNQDIKQVRDSHVYMKRDGKWQMIMGQTTPILQS